MNRTRHRLSAGRLLPFVAAALAQTLLAQRCAGQSNQGQFVHPAYVAIDRQGNLYVSEPERDRVRKLDSAGNIIGQWGSSGTADGKFARPQGIAVDDLGNVYVADSGNARVQKFGSDGTYFTKWGTFGTAAGQFYKPVGVAIAPNGTVLITDIDLKRVQVFDSSGTFLRSWGKPGVGDGEFSTFQGPGGIATDRQGFVYISDTGSDRIQKFDALGNFVGWAGKCTSGNGCDIPNERSRGFGCSASTCDPPAEGAGQGQFRKPLGLAVALSGDIFIADWLNDRIQTLDHGGLFRATWGTRGSGSGELHHPVGVAVTPTVDVLVSDTGNNRIQRFTSAGAPVASMAADIRVSAAPTRAPTGAGGDVLIGPSHTKSFTINVQSLDNFAGDVALTASCCIDYNTSAPVMPGGISLALASNRVTVPRGGSVDTFLTVSTDANPRPGKYSISISAEDAVRGIRRWHYATVSVGPLPAEPRPPCPRFFPVSGEGPVGGGGPSAGPEVLSTNRLLTVLDGLIAGGPTAASFRISYFLRNGDALVMEVRFPRELNATTARMRLGNFRGWGKSMVDVNSRDCDAAGMRIQASAGKVERVEFNEPTTTTVVFSKEVCTFALLFCWTVAWEDVAVWSEPLFWTVFGGRDVSFEYVER